MSIVLYFDVLFYFVHINKFFFLGSSFVDATQEGASDSSDTSFLVHLMLSFAFAYFANVSERSTAKHHQVRIKIFSPHSQCVPRNVEFELFHT